MKSALAINVEYALLRGTCALVNAIPYRVACALAKGMAWAAVRVFRFQRRRTISRIASVFPEKSQAELLGLAVASFENVLLTGLEMMRAPSFDREWIDRHVEDVPKYKAELQRLVDEGKGVVVMVPHTGNWYMAAWALAKYGLPLFAIAARQRNPKLNAWMERQYGDIEVLDRDCRDTLSRIRQKLNAGGVFAILPDLRVRKQDVAAPFLRGTANVSRAGALFATKTGAPIVVAAMRRERGRHVFAHLATLRTEGRSAEDLTREALSLLSDFILKHPEQWFWYNKRWILEPVS